MKTTLGLAAALIALAALPALAQRTHKAIPAAAVVDVPDDAVKAGDDFDRYVNGAWAKGHAVPSDRTWVGTWADLQSQAVAQSRTLVEAAAAEGAPVGVLYASYLNQEERNRQGLRPLHGWLAEIDSIRDGAALANEIGRLARIDVAGFVLPAIGEDDGRPGHRVLSLRQGGLGLPDASAYQASEGAGRARRDAYRTFLIAMLASTGAARAEAGERADAVLAFESRLARAQVSRDVERDAAHAYHPMSVQELEARAPGFAWHRWLAGLGAARIDRIIVPQPEALRAQAAVVRATPLPVLRDHLKLRLLSTYSRYLDADTTAARFDYFGKALRGTQTEAPAWRRGVELVTNLLPETLGRTYAARYFPAAAKHRARAIAESVRAALVARVSEATWLSETARREVREKLQRTRLHIGYPDTWPATPAVVLRDDRLVENVAGIHAWRFARAVVELDLPIGRDEWTSPVSVPNAYASASANEIIFPAAVLQPPMFDPSADPAANYARLGATIGHELSHLFDDQGRHYDATGQLRETWNAADVRQFDVKVHALVEQLATYTPLPGEHVNGDLVIGESLADLAGVQAAHDAFLATPGAVAEGRRVADRRFFIAWAQLWRSTYRPEYLRTLLHTDAHPPGAVRLSIVRNLDAWYDAFQVKAGDRLFTEPAERIRIW
jgi:putative endopeptidase